MLNNYKCRTYSRLKNKLLPYLTVTVPKIKSCNYLAGYIFNISTTFPLVLEVFQYNCSDDFTFIQSWGKVRFIMDAYLKILNRYAIGGHKRNILYTHF